MPVEGSIAIVPIGAISRSLIKELAQAIPPLVGLPCEVIGALGHPKYAFNPQRDQYHSSALLRRISLARHPRNHPLALGVCEVDLFMPEVNFIFGDADRGQSAGVVSTTRLDPNWYGRDPDPDRLLRRILSEALGEIGHLLRLAHCQHETCAMFQSNTLSDTDRKQARYSDACAVRIAEFVAADADHPVPLRSRR